MNCERQRVECLIAADICIRKRVATVYQKYNNDKCKKTAVYTNVNGDIVSYISETAKIKKVILPSNTSSNVNVLLSNVTFFIFAVFDM